MIQLTTDYPLATDSPDYWHPAGAVTDNTQNRDCNEKIKEIFGRPIKVLDLGCSGGGFVYDLIQDGHLAVGLEGSDYSKLHGRAMWPVIPQSLFTCDISKPFVLMENEYVAKFDLITAWELMEHFKKEELETVLENINNHLCDDGIFMASIANIVDIYNPVHQNVEPVGWWIKRLAEGGLVVDRELNKQIGLYGWLRGPYGSRWFENDICVGQHRDTFSCAYRKGK